MILAAGLTPAWQQILLFDSFHPGEVNRAREAQWCASGKVLNVGLALHHLGAPCKTLSLVGGQTGTAIQQKFEKFGIAARWVPSAATTRVCTTIIDRSRSEITELVENSPAVAASELEAFAEAYAEEAAAAEVVVLSGSLPQGTPATFYRDLLMHTRCPVILDARGPELLAALESSHHAPRDEPQCSHHAPRDEPRHATTDRPADNAPAPPHAEHEDYPGRFLLVKPNREELARTLGQELRTETDLLAAMRELNHRGAEWVVVTHGKEAVLLTSREHAYRFRPPSAVVVNPIGCGDCLAAGIAWGLYECARSTALPALSVPGEHPIAMFTVLRLGLAAAGDNLWQLLPARLDPDRVLALTRSIAIETIDAE